MSDEGIAHHEAGHAVVACAVGLGPAIREVTIVPRPGDYAGCVHFQRGAFDDVPSRHVLTMLWAGELAARWHQDRCFRPVALYATDQEQALAIARANSIRWEHSRGEAEQIITAHWSLIRAIADVLLDRKTLTGDVIFRCYINARAAEVAKHEANY